MFDKYLTACLVTLAVTGSSANAQTSDPTDSSQGLWVGDVVLDEVSAVDDPNDVQATPDTARIRMILHVDNDGQVYLLQKAILVSGAGTGLKLFTDEARIPAFAKDAKHTERIVKHFETASFDLPRQKLPPHPLPKDFLPTSLAHEYETEHLLEGKLKPGEHIRTRPGKLVIDRWHRTNPYRHAFHPNHTVGFRIVREIELVCDKSNKSTKAKSSSDTITGTYNESVYGLLKPKVPVVMAGRFALQRISETTRHKE